jgi:hypothetical protein
LQSPRGNEIAGHAGDLKRDRKEGEASQEPLGPPFLAGTHSSVNLGNGDRTRRQRAASEQKLLNQLRAAAFPIQDIDDDAGIK